MRKFVNDPRRNKVSAKKAEISEIFKWFRKDFTRDAGTVRDFLNRYADKKLDANGRITHIDYDWKLNESK
jgi:malate synthase